MPQVMLRSGEKNFRLYRKDVNCIRKKALVVILLLLILFSALYWTVIPKSSGLPSYRLTVRKTENGNTVRTDYLNGSDSITNASDKYYATVIKTYDNGHVILEQYFDAEGNPAVQTLGHCGLARHYDSDGFVDRITYLDAEGNPIITTSGYNSVHRTYSNHHLSETDTYYIDEEQVENFYGFYSLCRVRNEKKQIHEISYCDERGELTLHKTGYARIRRSYNDAGKIEYEFYFDVKDDPVSILSGFFGLYREYDENGKTTLTTYLDADGQPMEGSRGYATSVKTYSFDGTVSSIRYFGSNGEPVTAGRNHYGIEYVDGQGVYLDENGERMLRIDNFLNTHPLAVMVCGLVLTAAAVMVKGRGRIAFIAFYVLFIGIMTLAYRESGASKWNFQLFWSYRQFFKSMAIRQEILNNIWLFVPLGAVLYSSEHPLRWLWAILLSVVIEMLQLFCGIGLCELDDIVSNSMGALLGYFVSVLFSQKSMIREAVY